MDFVEVAKRNVEAARVADSSQLAVDGAKNFVVIEACAHGLPDLRKHLVLLHAPARSMNVRQRPEQCQQPGSGQKRDDSDNGNGFHWRNSNTTISPSRLLQARMIAGAEGICPDSRSAGAGGQ